MSEVDEEGGKMEIEEHPQKDIKQVDISLKQGSHRHGKPWGGILSQKIGNKLSHGN